jgi:hypothetical protein
MRISSFAYPNVNVSSDTPSYEETVPTFDNALKGLGLGTVLGGALGYKEIEKGFKGFDFLGDGAKLAGKALNSGLIESPDPRINAGMLDKLGMLIKARKAAKIAARRVLPWSLAGLVGGGIVAPSERVKTTITN